MPFLWTEGRFIMNRLEVPTLKEIPAERIYEQVLVGGGSILLKKQEMSLSQLDGYIDRLSDKFVNAFRNNIRQY